MAEVLVIDDDPDCAEALAEIIRVEGHGVRVGFNGEEGLRLLAAQHPDLVLVDVEMPIVGGPDMAAEMLVRDAGLEKIPVVFLSGVPDLPKVAARVGTPYFLGKPYRYDDLVKLVGRALRERVPPSPPLVRSSRG